MRRTASLLLSVFAGTVLAAQAQTDNGAPLKLRAPAGPVTITADRAEFDQAGVMRYRGNVRLVSDELTLTGEFLELRQPVRGEYETHVTGNPAKLVHAAEGDAPQVAASAGAIHYDTRTGIADLTEKAQLERGKDILSGDNIRYDVAARRIQATGANGGQVRIVIQPPDRKEKEPGKEKEKEKEKEKSP